MIRLPLSLQLYALLHSSLLQLSYRVETKAVPLLLLENCSEVFSLNGKPAPNNLDFGMGFSTQALCFGGV